MIERLCYGCNEKYEVEGDEAPCPECGQQLRSVPTLTGDPLLATAREDALWRPDGIDDEDEEPVGQTLGVYAVEGFVGRGGMARVYRARHLGLERWCALKVLSRRSVSHDPVSVRRFVAEARAAAGLIHPHVVTVHNIVETDGRHIIEMELVEGSSLSRQLTQRRRFDSYEATRLMAEVCSGLAAAHEQGVIHRDLKPSNVLMSRGGTAKLADFGLAKRLLAPKGALDEPLAGTPHFMAPELFTGLPASPASDVYAAGVTYYFLLTGRPPFAVGTLSHLIRHHLQGEMPDVRKLAPATPDRAAAILDRCFERDPRRRFAGGGELRAELRSLLGLLRRLDDLIGEALDGLDVQWRRRTDDFEVVVPLDGERRQRVYIEEITPRGGDEPLIRISSPCAPVEASYCRRALELNGEVDHGAIAIQSLDGEEYFVMRSAYPRATCDPEELQASVLTVARGADAVEEALTGRDRH